MPGWQKPHWSAPQSAKARWTGSSPCGPASPSMVVSARSCASCARVMQDRMGSPRPLPSRGRASTVQAPQSPLSHPCLLPVSPSSYRSASSSVRCTGTARVCSSPFTSRRTSVLRRCPVDTGRSGPSRSAALAQAPATGRAQAWMQLVTLEESGPEAADRLERAVRATPGVAPGGALAADAEVAEREVEPDGVGRVERAQTPRHLLGRAPGQVLAPREPDEAADAVHVRVERHDQRAARHVPQPEVDAVGAAHHPPEKQVEALAGAPPRGVREEVLEPPRRAALPEQWSEVRRAQLVDELAQRDPERARYPPPRGEERAQGPVCAHDPPGPVEQAGHVPRAGHPVGEAGAPPEQLGRRSVAGGLAR